MWYVPKKNIYDKKPSAKDRKIIRTVPGHFMGIAGRTGLQEALNTEWVETNIGERMRNYLLSNAGKRCKLPAGDTRDSGFDQLEKLKVPNAPPCVHQQKQERTCVFSSFASCVHYLGHVEMGKRIQALAWNQSYRMNNLERLQVAVNTSLGKKCCIRKYKTNKLDLLDVSQQHETNGSIHPTIVVLEGDDGGIEHAVTVYGSWVFDSNVNVALPLTRKTLDWCVMGKYVAVHEAIRFFLPISKLERKRKKQKKH